MAREKDKEREREREREMKEGGGGRGREEGEGRERERDRCCHNLFVAQRPGNMYLRDGSALKIVRAATLR